MRYIRPPKIRVLLSCFVNRYSFYVEVLSYRDAFDRKYTRSQIGADNKYISNSRSPSRLASSRMAAVWLFRPKPKCPCSSRFAVGAGFFGFLRRVSCLG